MDEGTFLATYNSNTPGQPFADNSTRDIVEATVRQFAADISNSFEYKTGASSVLSSQVYNIGDWNMANPGGGAQSIKQVYCGSSGNVANTKFFGVEVRADSDAILPGSKFTSPYFISGINGPQMFHGSLFVLGASSVINISASGTVFATGTDFDTSSNYNRGYVTLFF